MPKFNKNFFDRNKSKFNIQNDSKELVNKDNDRQEQSNNFDESYKNTNETIADNPECDNIANQSLSDTITNSVGVAKTGLHTLPINVIEYATNNPFNIRDNDMNGRESFRELVDSISVNGLIHPLTVNYINDKYYLISGERRLKALKELQWDEVPCFVISESDENKIMSMVFAANIDVRTFTAWQLLEYCEKLTAIYRNMLQSGTISGSIRQKVSAKMQISERQLAKYSFVRNNLDKLSEDDRNGLVDGTLTLNKAYKILKQINEPENNKDTIESKSTITENVFDEQPQRQEETDNISDEDLKTDTTESNEVSSVDLETTSNVNEEVQSKDVIEDTKFPTEESLEDDNAPTATVDIKKVNPESSIDFINNLIDDSDNPVVYEAKSMHNGRDVYGVLVVNSGGTFLSPTNSIKVIQESAFGDFRKTVQMTLIPVDKETLKRR